MNDKHVGNLYKPNRVIVPTCIVDQRFVEQVVLRTSELKLAKKDESQKRLDIGDLIWKGVSATMWSGRYTLSYPRGRVFHTCLFSATNNMVSERVHCKITQDYTALQRQKAVATYLKSKQLLPGSIESWVSRLTHGVVRDHVWAWPCMSDWCLSEGPVSLVSGLANRKNKDVLRM